MSACCGSGGLQWRRWFLVLLAVAALVLGVGVAWSVGPPGLSAAGPAAATAACDVARSQAAVPACAVPVTDEGASPRGDRRRP